MCKQSRQSRFRRTIIKVLDEKSNFGGLKTHDPNERQSPRPTQAKKKMVRSAAFALLTRTTQPIFPGLFTGQIITRYTNRARVGSGQGHPTRSDPTRDV